MTCPSPVARPRPPPVRRGHDAGVHQGALLHRLTLGGDVISGPAPHHVHITVATDTSVLGRPGRAL